ncbi:hypothetical protein QR680_008398 [Steinernema hermaphroditum]|uniref:Homeobox domain-containing protein n=1 Tax=Steinernema hermaphroditum TaxID=289476 RepID=A0AA39IGF9_9BILA|nr:hypothetical protein QR680_008398 [Steinernema hermaphroditum]
MVIVDCIARPVAELVTPESTPPAHEKASTKENDVEMKSLEETHIEDSDASTSSAADEKAKLHAQSRRLEKWLENNGNNLYPSRPEKDKLAKDMGMTLIQVTRWFANRRRKQHKRPKACTCSAEDRSKHIQDIVDEVVQRTNAGEFLQLSSSSLDIDVDEFDEHCVSDVPEAKENEKDHLQDMRDTLNDIWIKALKNALSSTAWLQQQQQQQQSQQQPTKPSEEPKKSQQKGADDSGSAEEKDMVVGVSQSPVSSLISADPCAGKDKLMRPHAEQHHGFVTPPPSVLPRIDSASSLIGVNQNSGFHQVPDLHHSSPVLTPEHHHPLQQAAHLHPQQNDLITAQMLQAGQYQWMVQQMAAVNPIFFQQYQLHLLALQQQQKLQQFAASPPQTSTAASPFHVMPTTSTHHDVHVDIEASPPTPESFPGDIDTTISMESDTSTTAASEEDEVVSDEEVMSRLNKAHLDEKEALAVLVLAGLSCQ